MCEWKPKDGIVRNPVGLSRQQRKIMKWLAEGETTKSIALMMKRSVKTVEYHRTMLKAKVGVQDMAALTKLAIWWGMTDVVSPLRKA